MVDDRIILVSLQIEEHLLSGDNLFMKQTAVCFYSPFKIFLLALSTSWHLMESR